MFPFLFSLVLTQGCTSSPTRPNHTEKAYINDLDQSSQLKNHVQAKELGEYHEIESLFKDNQTEDAQSKIVKFIGRFPKSSLLPSVENMYGLVLLQNKKSTDAVSHFKKAVSL